MDSKKLELKAPSFPCVAFILHRFPRSPKHSFQAYFRAFLSLLQIDSGGRSRSKSSTTHHFRPPSLIGQTEARRQDFYHSKYETYHLSLLHYNHVADYLRSSHRPNIYLRGTRRHRLCNMVQHVLSNIQQLRDAASRHGYGCSSGSLSHARCMW